MLARKINALEEVTCFIHGEWRSLDAEEHRRDLFNKRCYILCKDLNNICLHDAKERFDFIQKAPFQG